LFAIIVTGEVDDFVRMLYFDTLQF